MKKILIYTFLSISCFANMKNINQFEADFIQKVTDENNKTITYTGHLKASKPEYALWIYKKPVIKTIFIIDSRVIVIEPELEQAIIRDIDSNFNFFKLIENAKKINDITYETSFGDKKLYFTLKNSTIEKINYKDEYDNNIEILFKNKIINKYISHKQFNPIIPQEYDIIRE